MIFYTKPLTEKIFLIHTGKKILDENLSFYRNIFYLFIAILCAKMSRVTRALQWGKFNEKRKREREGRE